METEFLAWSATVTAHKTNYNLFEQQLVTHSEITWKLRTSQGREEELPISTLDRKRHDFLQYDRSVITNTRRIVHTLWIYLRLI
jgi:hypothetical protein